MAANMHAPAGSLSASFLVWPKVWTRAFEAHTL